MNDEDLNAILDAAEILTTIGEVETRAAEENIFDAECSSKHLAFAKVVTRVSDDLIRIYHEYK